ncbi:hypothetical protein [Chroococcus sp. FPU101]|uniref:hypothetical protein n=1 Tax=Chroococcus sp. FPU101 TaxID=1974212 RepID=UPI001A8C2255|nr:hypothetical protein [Chroococcus sp. FPU101]
MTRNERRFYAEGNYFELEDDLRPEYDFSQMGQGVCGKYVERYQAGTNVVLLDPDVAKAFPTSESVNKTIR